MPTRVPFAIWALLLSSLQLFAHSAGAEVLVFETEREDLEPPLANVLPALKVQLPAVEQELVGELPADPVRRVTRAGQLLERPQVRIVVWLAPEDAPFDGQGPYNLTVVRRLPTSAGIEQVRVDAQTGPAGARTAALRIAELYRSAPAKTEPEPEPPAAETPQQTEPAEEQLLRWQVAAGAYGRFDPDSSLFQTGAALQGYYDLNLLNLSTGLQVGYMPRAEWRGAGGEGDVEEFNAAWSLRWLRPHRWAMGAELAAGVRLVRVEGRAADGFDGSASNVSPWVVTHGILAWQPAPWSVLASAGFDWTPIAQRYLLDARSALEVSPWAPSARLSIAVSF